MTIPATPSEQTYAGDGVSTVFPIPFVFDDASDLKVVETDSSGNAAEVTSGFSISGGAGSTGNLTRTSALAVGSQITILDDPALTQDVDYIANDSFPADAHERALDRIVRMVKRLSQRFSRSIAFPDGDPVDDGVLASVDTRKGKYLFFNAVTGAIEYVVSVATTVLSQSVIAQLLNPQTAAELAALVTPTNYLYKPGDIRRYGAISDGATDCSTAWARAIAQAQTSTADKAPVYVPGAQQGWKIVTGVVTNVGGSPFKIYGDSTYYSYLYTAANITILTVQNVQQLAGVVIQDVQFIGPGTGTSTVPGLYIRNSAYTILDRVYSRAFNTGVKFDGGTLAPNSSFSCSMYDSSIVGNVVNIDALAQTNFLCLYNVTFGSAIGAGGIGLRTKDCNGLLVSGGDCEGGLTCCVDLDASAGPFPMGAVLQSIDFENANGTQGIIRIGATAQVRGVSIIACNFSNAGAAQWLLNPINADDVALIAITGNTGLASGKWLNDAGTFTNIVNIANPYSAPGTSFSVFNGTTGYADQNLAATVTGRHADARVTITYSASMTPDASKGNTQDITITDGVAMAINAPTNPIPGQELTFCISNTSGGAHGAITWNAAFHLAGALAAIATGSNKSITFQYKGAVWLERYRSAADVAN